jgi:hypothetical protein
MFASFSRLQPLHCAHETVVLTSNLILILQYSLSVRHDTVSHVTRNSPTSIRRLCSALWRTHFMVVRSLLHPAVVGSTFSRTPSPAEAKDFSSSRCVQTSSEAHPDFYPMGTWGPFPKGKGDQGVTLTTKNLDQDSRSPGWDLNPNLPNTKHGH